MGFCLCGLVLLLLLPIGNSSSFFNIISFELVFGHFFFGFFVLFFFLSDSVHQADDFFIWSFYFFLYSLVFEFDR